MTEKRSAILMRLGTILRERLRLVSGAGALAEQTGLLGQGIGIDSVEALQVVAAIEEKLGLTVNDDELKAEYFQTVGSLVTFIEERWS